MLPARRAPPFSFDVLIPAIRTGGRLTQAAVTNQLNVMKAMGAVEGTPETTEGVLWTNAYNK